MQPAGLERIGGSGRVEPVPGRTESNRAVLPGSSARDRSGPVRRIGGILYLGVKSMTLDLSCRGLRGQAVGGDCRPLLASPLPPFITRDLDERGIMYMGVD